MISYLNLSMNPTIPILLNDFSAMFYQFEQELQYSPTPLRSTHSPSSNKLQYRRSSSNSAKDISTPDHSKINSHYVPPSPKTSVLSPTNFIRIHLPHKHIIVVSYSFLP